MNRYGMAFRKKQLVDKVARSNDGKNDQQRKASTCNSQVLFEKKCVFKKKSKQGKAKRRRERKMMYEEKKKY